MNTRSAQLLAAGLAALLVVVIGATVFLLLSSPPPAGPTPTPSASSTAVVSPSFTPTPLITPSPTISAPPTASAGPLPTASTAPTESPSPSTSPEPSASPSPSPTPTPSPTPSPSTTPTPTPSPTPSPTPLPSVDPTAPQREFTLRQVGIDSRALGEARVERVVRFTVDGPSLVTARVSNASAAGFRLCLYGQDDPIENNPEFCSTARNARVTRPSFESGQSRFFAMLIGTETNVSPFVDLTITYNANSGDLVLDNFRFVGTNEPAYNGFAIDLPTGGNGSLGFSASFDPGGAFTYRLLIEQAGGGTVRDDTGGPSQSVSTTDNVSGGETYRLSFRSPEAQSAAVFVRAEISWP